MNKERSFNTNTYPIRQLKVLQAPDLTAEAAKKLEASLAELPGVEAFEIAAERQELYIAFNEQVLSLKTLAAVMTEAGFPLRNIQAMLIQ